MSFERYTLDGVTSLTGWRLWAMGDGEFWAVSTRSVILTRRGVLYTRFAGDACPAWPDGEQRAVCRPPASPTDPHLSKPHDTPADGCCCGIYACMCVDDLLAYGTRTLPLMQVRDRDQVIGQVELTSPFAWGCVRGDPESTVRGAGGRVTGRVFVPRPQWRNAGTLQRKHPWVEVWKVESLADVPDVVAAA